MAQRSGMDWYGLLLRAVTGGVAASVVLALLVLAAGKARADEIDAGLQIFGADRQVLGYAPQLHTDVSIQVTGMLARVRVQQRFHNPTDAWVEGVYVFPLPEDAAVDRLRLLYAERLIEGEIQEKQQARETYERARASGQGATLLDQQRANIFTTSVANIPPGDTVQVEIEYQQNLHWLDSGFSLRFPSVVGPRYIPGKPLATETPAFAGHGWAVDTDQVPDASRITPPVVVAQEQTINPLAIQVELDMGLVLEAIDSPYHPIEVESQENGRYRVRLAQREVPANRDFVLQWRPVLEQQPAAALFSEDWRDAHYKLLMVMPPHAEASAPTVPRELVLVVDTSGSMHGDSIAQARAALLGALGRLRPEDRFNVIQFNSHTHALFDRAMPADAEHLDRARRYVAALRAEGGTEMLPAMRRALHDPQPSGLLRQVVFLTDGAIGNEESLFGEISRELADSRLFTVGIGSAPNALFMRRAAEHGRGSFTYIGSTAEVDEKVGGLFRRLSAPVLTDVRLTWQAGDRPVEVTQAPQRIPDLYAGEPLVLAARSAEPVDEVLIEGRFGRQPWQHRVRLRDGASGAGVHALWARRTIREQMARLASGGDAAQIRDAVLALALEHHLVSRYTSLVAVDRTPSRPANETPRSAPVPTLLPAGWSAQHVFGRMPGTATPAPLLMLGGLASLLLAFAVRRVAR